MHSRLEKLGLVAYATRLRSRLEKLGLVAYATRLRFLSSLRSLKKLEDLEPKL